VAQQIQAGDAFFNLTQASFPLALRNPTSVDIVSPTLLTPSDQADAVVRSLEAHRTQFIFLPHFHLPPGTTCSRFTSTSIATIISPKHFP
jgi:hypothetical protein